MSCNWSVWVVTEGEHGWWQVLFSTDHVLCRTCGAELTENTRDNFVNISSPLSESSQQLSILGHPHLMVQTLRNPADLSFDLVTVRRSGCSGVGEVRKTQTPLLLCQYKPKFWGLNITLVDIKSVKLNEMWKVFQQTLQMFAGMLIIDQLMSIVVW